MIKQFLRKRAKITFGLLNTYVRKKGQAYDDSKWWDSFFYTEGVSDRKTLAQNKSAIAANYHYASMELQILKYLQNNGPSTNECSVLDIGSGSGHWIDFYRRLGARNVTGLDVSHTSVRHLEQKYSGESSVQVHQGKAAEVISSLNGGVDIVNAVGVMFHIVDDLEWEKTICAIAGLLRGEGLFIVGGHFGFLNGINVQIDRNGFINKRLRSKGKWLRTLRAAGFSSIKLYRNNAYLWVNETLPENNVLIARK